MIPTIVVSVFAFDWLSEWLKSSVASSPVSFESSINDLLDDRQLSESGMIAWEVGKSSGVCSFGMDLLADLDEFPSEERRDDIIDLEPITRRE